MPSGAVNLSDMDAYRIKIAHRGRSEQESRKRRLAVRKAFNSRVITSILRQWRGPASLPPRAAARHCFQRNPEPAGSPLLGFARHLFPDHSRYAEIELPARAPARSALGAPKGIPTLPAFTTRVFPTIRSNCIWV